MKLSKAIEILDLNIKEAGSKMPTDTLDALKIGRHAIERIEECRLADHTIKEDLLPGETKE